MGAGLQDPEHDEEHADRRQDRPDRVEGARRVGWQGIDQATAQEDDGHDTRAWKTNAARQLIAVVMMPADQRPRRGADAAQPADHAEGPGTRRQIGEPQRREDVDRGDQQRRADAFEDRVAEDQHAEARGDRAQHGADPVQREARR